MKHRALTASVLALLTLNVGCDSPEVLRVGRSLGTLLGRGAGKPGSTLAAARTISCPPLLSADSVLKLFEQEPLKSCRPKVRLPVNAERGQRLGLPAVVSSSARCENETALEFELRRVDKGMSCGSDNRGFYLVRAEMISPSKKLLFEADGERHSDPLAALPRSPANGGQAQ